MSQGLYSGVSGLSLGTGLYKGNPGLWSGASGLITPNLNPVLSLNFLTGTLDPRITFTRAMTPAGTVATFVGSNGLIQTAAADTPRFDYNPVTLAPRGLLIEEAKANVILRSQEFDNNTSWTKTNGSVTADTIASPDGTTNADAFIENTTVSVIHTISQSVGKAASSIQYTASFYIKDKGRQVVVNLQGTTGLNGVTGRINPAAPGTVTSAAVAFGTGWTAGTISIADAGGGWYRVSMVATSDTTANAVLQLVLHNGTTTSYTGDGVSGAYLYGAQLELNSFAGSYIPTTTTLVTRGADVAVMTGTNFSDWFNPSEGTFVATASIVSTAANRGILAASDGGVINELFHYVTTSTNNLVASSGQTTTNSTLIGVTVNTVFSNAFAYRVGDSRAALNGTLANQVAPPVIPTVNQFRIGARGNNTFYTNGHIRSINYYNTRLPDGTLQSLTA